MKHHHLQRADKNQLEAWFKANQDLFKAQRRKAQNVTELARLTFKNPDITLGNIQGAARACGHAFRYPATVKPARIKPPWPTKGGEYHQLLDLVECLVRFPLNRGLIEKKLDKILKEQKAQ